MRIFLLSIILSFSFAINVRATVDMKSVTTHEGLAGETVFKIFKSAWNVMWIGTSNGLSSYDGYHLQNFRIGQQRSKNTINDIAQSNDGYIWTATKEGLYIVDGMKPLMTRKLPEIKDNISVIKIIGESIYCGSDNGLYVAPTHRLNKTFKHVWLTKNHIAGNNKINDIIADGKYLIILCNYELYRYDTRSGKVQSYNLRKRLKLNNPLRKLAKYGNRIFIGTFNDGMFVYNIKENSIAQYVDVGCRVITCLSVNGEGKKLYVGTDGSGLHTIDLKTNKIVETYSTADNSRFKLKDNTVYAYYQDSTGVEFFGYFRQGLQHNYYSKPLFHAYNIPGLFDSRGKNIRSICIDGNVKVLGGRGGLWYIDEDKRLTKFFSPHELGGSIVTNIVKYAGQYYCCTFNGGVMRIDPKTLTISRFGKSDALRSSSFGYLRLSPDNELWMAGNAGVYIYNAFTDEERHYDYRNSQLYDAYSNYILFDRQDRCWIATAKGLCLYDPIGKTIHSNGFPEGFFNNQSEISAELGVSDNIIFWSTDGLFSCNEEMTEFDEIKNETPVSQHNISQIKYDKRHKCYWVTTEGGIFRYDRNLRHFQKFGAEAGIPTREFSNNAIIIENEKTLWTGTMHGLFYCNLNDADNYDIGNAHIALDEVTFDGASVAGETVAEMVRLHTIKISYNWGAQTFKFTPVLMNYCDQSQLCFEYRFNGEGNWKYVDGQEQITVKNLPAGQTILEIRIAGSKHITKYFIYVIPSGWFWFEIIGIALFGVSLILLYIQRRQAHLHEMEMQRVQQEQELAKRKYSRINTDEDEQHRLLRRLEEYMKDEKPYLNNELKLSDMASYLHISTVKLSQLFSMHVQKNYYDYINQWRLEEFKTRLNDKKYSNYTLLALAGECGFKRSSFFSTFKKVEGVTPTEYVRLLKNKKT